MSAIDYLFFLDCVGIGLFAATGALVASRKQLDVVGFIFMAAITGMGGGTLRDMILGKLPVFWVQQPAYIMVCVGVAVLVFFTAHLFESRYRLLIWLDAIGLAAYCIVGTTIGLNYGISPLAAIVTGVMTACFGGILRDVISGEKTILLSNEVYITAAILGSSSFVLLNEIGVAQNASILISVSLAFGLRAVALLFGVKMPRYRARKGRDVS